MGVEFVYVGLDRPCADPVEKPTKGEGAHVDGRTGRTEYHDEAEQVWMDGVNGAPRKPTHYAHREEGQAGLTSRIPVSRFLQVLLVHSIPGNGDLANIVEQILDQNLQSRHLQPDVISKRLQYHDQKYLPVGMVAKRWR